MKKKLLFIFLPTAAALLFFIAQPALALEVSYPVIGDLNINQNPTLLNFIQYFFTFAILVVGMIAIVSVVISGFKILLSAGSAEEINDAKAGIWGAALGIALLFASFILINTINPQLVSPSLTALPQQVLTGVILEIGYEGGVDSAGNLTDIKRTPAPQSIANIIMTTPGRPDDTFPPSDYGGTSHQVISRKIRYACTPPSNGVKGKNLLVWRYNKPNFEIDRNQNGKVDSDGNYPVDTWTLPCNNEPNNYVNLLASTKSYKWAYEEPGVYFYLTKDFKGIMSKVYTAPSQIEPFDCDFGAGGGWSDGGVGCEPTDNDQVPKSMRIVNSKEKQFGVILNQEAIRPDGRCSYPLLNKDVPAGNNLVVYSDKNIETNTIGFDSSPRYAYVFEHIPAPSDGQVKIESQSLYVDVKAGNFDPAYNYRLWRLRPFYSGNLNVWLNSLRTEESHWLRPGIAPSPEECSNPNVSCLKFIRGTTSGNQGFRVVLYSDNNDDEEALSDDVCQVYTSREINFSAGAGAVAGALVPPQNNNRWIFNSRRVLFDAFIIPMPRAVN